MSPNLFEQFLLWPIINLLLAFYVGLSSLHIPGAFGWSIIALTIFIRLLLHPLTVTQLRSAKKMAELKPHLDRLGSKHKNDKTRLQQEQMRLYKEAGVNPAAGCLPLLIQLPVLIALYNVFFKFLGSNGGGEFVGNINKIAYFPFLQVSSLDLSFLGMDLTTKPSQWQSIGAALLLTPVITALLQFIQAKIMAPAADKPQAKKGEGEDMAQAMQTQMTFFMPLMIGYFSYSFPLGLSLYWNTFTIFAIIQQVIIGGWGGMKPYINKFKVKSLKVLN